MRRWFALRAPEFRRPFFLTVLLALALGAGTVRAADQSTAPSTQPALQERLGALLAKLPAQTQVGLVVADAKTGAAWFTHEPDTPLKPASVQKLLVTAAALERFGPSFQYQTRVELRGDELWVSGAGDPALGDQQIAERHGQDAEQVFDDWAAALRAWGVESLARIVLDDSVFDALGRHPDWPADQADRWYQAPVGALNLNDNCLDVQIELRSGQIRVQMQPDLPPELIDNELKPGKKQRPTIARHPGDEVFRLRGTVARSDSLRAVSAHQPTTFFGQALRRALEQRGIEIRGQVVNGRATRGDAAAPVLVATHATALPDILWRCNTFSQNMFAECLLKSLAAYNPDGQRSGTAGSWDAGRSVLKSTLADLGVDLHGAQIRDGSGLSHSNRATANQIVRLLVRMRHHRYADVFLASLAEPGQPGSMRSRYDDPALLGRLRGKTGTISGVRTLAGYIERPDGRVLAFALLINGKAEPTLPTQVCRIIVGAD